MSFTKLTTWYWVDSQTPQRWPQLKWFSPIHKALCLYPSLVTSCLGVVQPPLTTTVPHPWRLLCFSYGPPTSWLPFVNHPFLNWSLLKLHTLSVSLFLVGSLTKLYLFHRYQFSSVQLLGRVRLFATPWIAARQASLSITNSPSSSRLTSIESVMPSSHLILCCPLLLLSPTPPSIRVFSNESTLFMRWPKYWSFSFSISPSKEHPGLISFRMHWLDLLAVQGTLKSLLQQHSSKASILRHSAFFTVQLSHPYMTTGKTIALTRHYNSTMNYVGFSQDTAGEGECGTNWESSAETYTLARVKLIASGKLPCNTGSSAQCSVMI